ncbi:MAG: hypothetical protein C0394_04355 [Syntrophus sp. (in: bacteria)]|nr:hypothetical protein [Syntrophus sp. (in: bacteria)]
MANGAGLCLFGLFIGAARVRAFDWLNAATGWRKTPEDYLEIGERIQTLKQLFNIRHGIDPWSFKVGNRAAGWPPQTKGANRGRTMDMVQMMGDYWRQFGWDAATGIPTKAAIARLEINERE